jgi:hypothetical protein
VAPGQTEELAMTPFIERLCADVDYPETRGGLEAWLYEKLELEFRHRGIELPNIGDGFQADVLFTCLNFLEDNPP